MLGQAWAASLWLAAFFAGLLAEEAVAGTPVVDVGVVGFVVGGHLFFGGLDGGGDAGIVAAVEAGDGAGDFVHGVIGRGRAVVDDGGIQGWLIGCVGEACPAAPAEADRRRFLVAEGWARA